jgi:hypothetical protein
MAHEPLLLPRGIRYPHAEEIPAGAPADANDRVAEAQRTVVTTGYVRNDHDGTAGYTAVVEANVHAADLFRMFSELVAALLPSVTAPMVGVIDEDPLLGKYTHRSSALAVLAPYADPLTHDGFLEFGCIFQHRGRIEEVFVPSAKFIRVWTNSPESTEAVLVRNGITAHPALRFVDEFPLVREAQPFAGATSGWSVVLDELREKFAQLPDPRSRPRTRYSECCSRRACVTAERSAFLVHR